MPKFKPIKTSKGPLIGVMVNASNSASNLLGLRHKVKSNPGAYRQDVIRQLNHWKSLLQLLQISTAGSHTKKHTKELQSIIEFLSHVVHKYKDFSLALEFPSDLTTLLDEHVEILNPALRKSIIKNLVILESNGMMNALQLLPLFFRLLSVKDKTFRYLIYSSIINIIVRVNKHCKNDLINKNIQNYMFTMLKDEDDMCVKKSLTILIELYRKNIWKSTKIVNVIADICVFHKSSPVVRNSLHFMLGHKISLMEEELQTYKERELASKVQQIKFNTRRAKKKFEKVAKIQDQMEKKKEQLDDLLNENEKQSDMGAIRSLYDPQKFAERLFNHLKKSKDMFDIKLLMIDLLSRIIASHQLILFPFYSFMLKFLKSYQKNVTQLIAYTAQGVHRLVPPEIVEPVIKHIVDEFVGQHSAQECVAVGINAVRWICSRQPLAMNSDLLQDLSLYVKYRRDKGVQMAARGLIHLYRVENPDLLSRKDRGKYHRKEEATGYGEVEVATDLAGADLFLAEESFLNRKTQSETIDEDNEDDEDDEDDEDNEDDDENEDENKDKNTNLKIEDNNNVEMKEVDGSKSTNNDLPPPTEEKNETDTRPLMARRILSDEDIQRLRELRVKNLMKVWNRTRDEVALKEEQDSDIEIEPDNIESLTTIRRKEKENRALIAKSKRSKKMTWDEYRKEKGGGSTNIEKKRMKAFHMSKYANTVLRKQKRSCLSKLRSVLRYKQDIKSQGKRVKRRRR